MLTHQFNDIKTPSRVVIIGKNSFIGKTLIKQLSGKVELLLLGRDDIDLCDDDAGGKLASLLNPTDSVVAISAVAPCRNSQDFIPNAKIIHSLVTAFTKQPVAHIVNISSDAVYPDELVPLTEQVPAAPSSMHGAMHLSREIALTDLGIDMAILRPTLIFGATDPHNGYGPNQFRRKVNNSQSITLFGEGEERRDHVWVEDVADIISRTLHHKSTGILNIASGTVTSFHDIALKAIEHASSDVEIKNLPRSGPMPHNGYRPFNVTATTTAFPDFVYTSLDEGMARAQKLEFGND